MSHYLIERIEADPRIDVVTRTEVRALAGDTHLSARPSSTPDRRTATVASWSGLFCFIGADPATAWLGDCVALDRGGFIITDRSLPDTIMAGTEFTARAPAVRDVAARRVRGRRRAQRLAEARRGRRRRRLERGAVGARAPRHEHIGGFMAKFTRGFTGRGKNRDPRLPPGQYDTGKRWPVLTAEVTPKPDTRDVDVHRRGSGRTTDHVDLGRDPRAPAVDLRRRHPLRHHVVEARRDVRRRLGRHAARRRRPLPTATHVLAFSHTGYTTNLPLADVTGGKAWVAWEYEGEPLPRRARRPGPPARAPPLLLEERQVGRGAARARPRRAGLLGAQRLPRPRRPVARAALPG